MFNPKRKITFCIQHFGNVQVFLSYVKSQVQVPHRVILNKETQIYITEQQCMTYNVSKLLHAVVNT